MVADNYVYGSWFWNLPMPSLFQELDYRPTDLGTLILRRRWEPRLEAFIHEIKLGGDFVMTSAAPEVVLAERGPGALA